MNLENNLLVPLDVLLRDVPVSGGDAARASCRGLSRFGSE
jgi:hypothetical protein